MKTLEIVSVKRGILGILLLLLMIATPVSGETYDRVSYIDGDIEFFVGITANTPWRNPFSETVNVSVDVVPGIENVIGVNLTRVTLIINRGEIDSSHNYLVTLERDLSAHIISNNPYANYTNSFTVSGSSIGPVCFFALLIEGSYGNGTHIFDFQSESPGNLVGPFTIYASLTTPTVWVGLLVLGLAGIVFIAGMFGIKKSRSRVRRKSLLDD